MSSSTPASSATAGASRPSRSAARATPRSHRSDRTCRSRGRCGAPPALPQLCSRRGPRARHGRARSAQTPPETCRQSSSAQTRSPPDAPRPHFHRRGKTRVCQPRRSAHRQQARPGARDDRSDRVRSLVHVRTEHDHDPRPLSPRRKVDTPADMACLGRCHAPIKSRRGCPRPATSDTAKASQTQQPTAR